MGIFGKIFGSTRPIQDSVTILLKTLPSARRACIFRIIKQIEELVESNCLTEGNENILERNCLNCDELITALNMYQVLGTLSKYITIHKEKDDILTAIAFQNKKHDGKKIFNKFVEIYKNREKLENSQGIGEYRAKLYYDIVSLLTAGTPIENDKRVSGDDPGCDYKRLSTSLETRLFFEDQMLGIDTAIIVKGAFDKEYSAAPIDGIVNQIQQMINQK